jgi:hypothetical protein
MNAHFNRKTHCPHLEDDVFLTDEIKEYVLQNRIYKKPQAETPVAPPPAPEQPQIVNHNTTNQIINNIQYINNYVNNMDLMDKLLTYKNYLDIKTMDFDDVVVHMYRNEIKKMERTPTCIDFMTKYDIKETIDNVSTMHDNSVEFFCITQEGTKLKIFLNGQWETFLLEKGIKKIIEIIREQFFDNYEKYIIRKYKNSKYPQLKQEYKDRIEEYYSFIKCFDIMPFVKDNDDSDIFEMDYCDREYCDEFMDIYTKLEVPASHSAKIKKEITNIIKQNCKQNVSELNKIVASLIHMDDEFKNILLNHQLRIGSSSLPRLDEH